MFYIQALSLKYYYYLYRYNILMTITLKINLRGLIESLINKIIKT